MGNESISEAHGSGGPWIVVEAPDGVTGDGEGVIFIPLTSVAVESELLGYENMDEGLQAIIHKLKTRANPAYDQETGKGVWTDPFTLLSAREQAREDAAEEVKTHPGHTEHQVQVASAQMAYRSVHEPIGGGECALDRCRRAAREEMGLPEPSAKCGATSRGEAPRVLDSSSETGAILTDEALEYLGKARSAFLHSLSGRNEDDNPLGDMPPPAPPENPIRTADELLAHYQEGAA